MRNYRRLQAYDGTFFLTLVTMNRRSILGDGLALQSMWSAYRHVQRRRPFRLLAWVVRPDHLHVLIELADGDRDFSGRMSQFKESFTKRWLARGGKELLQSASRQRQGNRGVWQKRFWEHTCRDADDTDRCFDYLHFNPVKHRHVRRVRDWRASSFRHWVRKGFYALDWAGATATEQGGPYGE